MVLEAANNTDKMVVEIVSEENIVPSSPTPDHLRVFKLSFLDQIQAKIYVPLLLFFHNNQTSNQSSVIFDRSKLLKQTLSQTLTQFYPLAGKVRDDFQIDCNDEGVHYVETRVEERLSDFLGRSPKNEMIDLFIPQNATASAIGNSVLMIRVNVFSCGGVAISSCINHKFIDGDTYMLFFKHWTAAARGTLETTSPSFTSQSLFPQIPSLNFQSPVTIGKDKFVSQRFVFDGIDIAKLKSKTRSFTSGSEPTRYEVVGALLWKCVAKAAYKVNRSSLETPFNLGMAINLRGKKDIPRNVVGNLVWPWLSRCKLATDLEHHYLANQIKISKAQLSDDFIQVIKGDTGTTTVLQCAEIMMNSEETSVAIWITTMCNMGVYELDFGWGKPVWFYYGNVNVANFISLCETRVGGGVEAVVSLSKEEIAIIEKDPELLAFASLNPAPL
ncbi:limonoid 7-O-acetyltransferse-like [Apium graveolens]|uniref:limonoid 7-O-acetyltransferse-like n=1 Tax=Apium graveolens TaxID=4045 RepID=UPI003D7BE517